MVSTETFIQLIMSFPEVSEQPHFEKTSFRVNKKIFATLNEESNEACIKLSKVDQHVFSTFDKSAIFPVPNKWGKQGWTIIKLSETREDILTDAVRTAYCGLATAKLMKVLEASEVENIAVEKNA